MRHLAIRRPSKPRIFGLLMLASLVMTLWPMDALQPARKMTQLVAPLQLAAHQTTLEASRAVDTLAAAPVSRREYDRALQATQALINENTALRQQNLGLESMIEELAGLRKQGWTPPCVLVPARVIGLDAVPGRDSLVVGKGRNRNVRDADWVVSALEVDAGTETGVAEASVVLARQCLIGWVEQAARFTSRVVLLSDRLARRPMKVYIDAAELGPQAFVLEGAGGHRMRVADIPARLVDAGHISVGGVVTSDPDQRGLPVPMVIGRIAELHLNRDNPVYYDAIIRYPYDPTSLSRVYIAHWSPAAAASRAQTDTNGGW